MPFTFHELDIPGPILIESRVFPDDRGFFFEAFKGSDFREAGIEGPIVQVNESVSARGVIRGIHYQIHPDVQGKIVRAAKGTVQDVAIDLRHDSPSFGHHVSVELSGDDHRALWIPPGFGHGACALDDDTQLLYLVTGNEYAPEAERGVHPLDPELAIDWRVEEHAQRLSERDAKLPPLERAELKFS